MSGRFAESQVQIRIARNLDPLSALIREAFGFLELLNRQYDAAITHYREEFELDPYFYKGHTSMGRAYIQKKMYREAIGHLEKGRLLAGDIPNILGALGQAWALSGNADKARGFLAELQQLSQRNYVPSTGMALIHLGLGEKNKALDLLGGRMRATPACAGVAECTSGLRSAQRGTKVQSYFAADRFPSPLTRRFAASLYRPSAR